MKCIIVIVADSQASGRPSLSERLIRSKSFSKALVGSFLNWYTQTCKAPLHLPKHLCLTVSIFCFFKPERLGKGERMIKKRSEKKLVTMQRTER